MSLSYGDPISNLALPWNICGYTTVNKKVRAPTIPSLGSFSQADANDDSESIEYGISIPLLDDITTVELFVYHGASTSMTPLGDIRIAGALLGSTAFTAIATDQWSSLTFNGSWTRANLRTGFSAIVTSDSVAKNQTYTVYAMYVRITGKRFYPLVT